MHTLRVTHLNAVMHSRLATVTLQTPLLQAAQRLSEPPWILRRHFSPLEWVS